MHAQWIYADGSINRGAWRRKGRDEKWEDGLSCQIARLSSKQKAIDPVAKNRLVTVTCWEVLRVKAKYLYDSRKDPAHCLVTGEYTKSPQCWQDLVDISKKVHYPDNWDKQRPKAFASIEINAKDR